MHKHRQVRAEPQRPPPAHPSNRSRKCFPRRSKKAGQPKAHEAVAAGNARPSPRHSNRKQSDKGCRRPRRVSWIPTRSRKCTRSSLTRSTFTRQSAMAWRTSPQRRERNLASAQRSPSRVSDSPREMGALFWSVYFLYLLPLPALPSHSYDVERILELTNVNPVRQQTMRSQLASCQPFQTDYAPMHRVRPRPLYRFRGDTSRK